MSSLITLNDELIHKRFIFSLFANNIPSPMKKILFLIALVGTFAVASCTKHACPAYGSAQKAPQSVQSERV